MIKRHCVACKRNLPLKAFATYRRQTCLVCNPLPLPPKSASVYERALIRQRDLYHTKIMREQGREPATYGKRAKSTTGAIKVDQLAFDIAATERQISDILADAPRAPAPTPARARDDEPNDLGTSTPAR